MKNKNVIQFPKSPKCVISVPTNVNNETLLTRRINGTAFGLTDGDILILDTNYKAYQIKTTTVLLVMCEGKEFLRSGDSEYDEIIAVAVSYQRSLVKEGDTYENGF